MKAIGIDLGTTNSAAAFAGREAKVLPNRAGEQLTPSVVSYLKKRKAQQGEIVVGRQAVNNAARDPENTVVSIKRLMGLVYGEPRVEEVRSRYSFRLAEAPPEDHEDQGVRVHLSDQTYTPTEISAMILSQIKADAEIALGEPVRYAVITVPAYFTERQRSATAEAGEQAGLTVLKIIDEPTAAAIAFGSAREDEQHRVLVYDLGGGTFDLSIIQMVGGQYQVLAIEGDNWLGGDDFDRAIVQRMIDWVKDEYGTDPVDDRSFLAKAREEAQRAKIALSSQTSAEIFAPLVRVAGEELADIEIVIELEQFEDSVRPLVDRTIELIGRALDSQHFNPNDITEALLVGGSTAIPLVQRSVSEVFAEGKVKRHVNPMECVAIGAAILASQFELKDDGQVGAEQVEDRHIEVTPMHLGIAAVKGANKDQFVPIIKKGTPYPLTEPKRRLFYPTEENQRLIKIPVYEGLNQLASLNEQQGILEFPLEEGVGTNNAIEVSFNYDRNRIITVGVRVIGTGQEFKEELQRDRARERRSTEKETLMDDWREDLQPTTRAAQQFLENYGEFMADEDCAEIEDALTNGKKSLEDDDEPAGKGWALILQNKIFSSGTASQLFMAERAMQGASEEVARELAQAVAELRQAHVKRDDESINRLSSVLRLRVAQVFHERERIDNIEDREHLDDLLRLRG